MEGAGCRPREGRASAASSAGTASTSGGASCGGAARWRGVAPEEADIVCAELAVTQLGKGLPGLGRALLQNCSTSTSERILRHIAERGPPPGWRTGTRGVPSRWHLQLFCTRVHRKLAGEGEQIDDGVADSVELALALNYIGQDSITEPRESDYDREGLYELDENETALLQALLTSEWNSLCGTDLLDMPTSASASNMDQSAKILFLRKLFFRQPMLLSSLLGLFNRRERVLSDHHHIMGHSFLSFCADVEVSFLQDLFDSGSVNLVLLLLPHLFYHDSVPSQKYEKLITGLLGDQQCSESALCAIFATGNLTLIKYAEFLEDKRLKTLYGSSGLIDYILQEVEQGSRAISIGDSTLLSLTRLHGEHLYLSLIEVALRSASPGREGMEIPKRVLSDLEKLHPLFVSLLWDRVVVNGHQDGEEAGQTWALEDLEAVFAHFKPLESASTNAVDQLWRSLKHRIAFVLALKSELKGKVDPMKVLREMNTKSVVQVLSDCGIYNHELADVVEKQPIHNYRQEVLFRHDLNVYHSWGFIRTFLKAFSLTCISLPESQESTQAKKKVDKFLESMQSHAAGIQCSFLLSWALWFCYVFFSCRYHENISGWRSLSSDLLKGESDASSSGSSRGSNVQQLPLYFFESMIDVMESLAGKLGSLDCKFIKHVLESTSSRETQPSLSKVAGALGDIVESRAATLEQFVEQGRWRLKFVKRMHLVKAKKELVSWTEIFSILHATPMRLLQVCKRNNEQGLCDETVRRYAISESEASTVQLAEWIDGLTTKDSVDGMISEMSMHTSPPSHVKQRLPESAVDKFEAHVMTSKMADLEKLLLYTDVAATVAPDPVVTERMLSSAKTLLEAYNMPDVNVPSYSRFILRMVGRTIAMVEKLMAEKSSRIPAAISSIDLQDNSQRLCLHTKAVSMLEEVAKTAEVGKRQFLSGVLHNISRALLADDSIPKESFKERLQSSQVGLQLLDNDNGKEEEMQHSDSYHCYLSSFISYLASVGDAIASVDGQDTYNHFSILSSEPKDILMYVLFERQNPEVAAQIAKLFNTSLIDEVLAACVPRIYPPLSEGESEDDSDSAPSEHNWAQNTQVLKSLVEKSPLRIAVGCLFLSLDERQSLQLTNEKKEILSFALEQSSSYPALHRWIKVQYFVHQMKTCVIHDSFSEHNSSFGTCFEHEHKHGSLKGCIWESTAMYNKAIEKIIQGGKPHEALLLADRCFNDGAADALLESIIEAEAKKSDWHSVFLFALRIKDVQLLWQIVNKFKYKWSLDELLAALFKCKSISLGTESNITGSIDGFYRKLQLYRRMLMVDDTYGGDWQAVEEACRGDHLELVLRRLSSLRVHKLAFELAEEFGVERTVICKLQSHSVLASLSVQSIDGGGIPGIFRSLSHDMEPKDSVLVAFFSLQNAKDIESKKACLSFLMPKRSKEKIQLSLTEEQAAYVRKIQTGIDVLDQLPGPLALRYESLVGSPSLIVENLIVSLEIRLAKPICRMFPSLSSSHLVTFYAHKALAPPGVKSSGHGAVSSIGSGKGFPILEGKNEDDATRETYRYHIAPSMPLCKAILNLTNSASISALNSARVVMKLSLEHLCKVRHGEVTEVDVLEDLERAEVAVELLQVAQKYFETALLEEEEMEFDGWSKIWEAEVESGTSCSFDLEGKYREIVSVLDSLDSASSYIDLHPHLVDIAKFAVRLDLIYTTLAQDIPMSFLDLDGLPSIQRVLQYLMKEEYYSIAIFLSNKFALSPSKIWESWGIGLLKLGEYTEGRMKIERAIVTSQQFHSDGDADVAAQRIALNAVEALESFDTVVVSDVYDAVHDVAQSSKSLKGRRGTLRSSAKPSIMEQNYSQCVYYLNYAPKNLLEFYFRQKQYGKACLSAFERSDRDLIEHLCKISVDFGKDDELLAFCKGQLVSDAGDEVDIGTRKKEKCLVDEDLLCCISYFCSRELYEVAYKLQILRGTGAFAAVLAMKAFKRCKTAETAEIWLTNSVRQLQNTPMDGGKHLFKGEEVDCTDLGTSNLLELRSNAILQLEIMKYLTIEKGSFLPPASPSSPSMTFSSRCWDIIGSSEATSFNRKNTAEWVLFKDANLSFRMIQEYRLPAVEVYLGAIYEYCKNRRQIGQLVTLVKGLKGTISDSDWDIVIGSSFNILLKDLNDRSNAKQMMKLLVSDHSKVLALIELGKLQGALDLAVSCSDSVDVRLIRKHARGRGSRKIVAACEKYLDEQEGHSAWSS